MGADSDDDRIRAGGEYILSTRNKRGLYFPSPGKERFILCLSANILRGLCKLGFDRDERVLEGLENVAVEIVKDGGVMCMVMDYSLLPDCFMTLPFILATLTTIPAEKRSGTVKEAMQIVTDRILEREVFVYVPANIEEWRKYSWDLTRSVAYGKKLATIKREKVRWLVEKGISGYVEKEGWKSFGFPLHYNPDILEALLALKSAEVVMGPQLEKALEAVEKKVSVDGKWKLNRTLNGKMVADVEVKGQASKWVTVRALEVLDYFGRMEH
jgi:hypothetical protein